MLAPDTPICATCGHPRSIPARACEVCGSECDWGTDDDDEQEADWEDDLTAAKRQRALEEEEQHG